MPKWVPLEQGDVVDIIAPSWACTKKELALGIDRLKEWGLVPRVDKDIFAKDYLCANTIQYRQKKLLEALNCKTSKAIWCVRGGYGAIHLLPFLNSMTNTLKKKISKNPKIFIGLSDITSLHSFLNQELNWPTLHGPLIDRLANDLLTSKDKKELKNILFAECENIEFKNLKYLGGKSVKKEITGKVVGGNLTVVCSQVGTSYQLKGSGKVLFFEDIGERGYRVDRMLYQMQMAGVFKGVKAIVLGDFTGCEEVSGEKLWLKVWKEFAGRMPFPVLKGVQSGHDKRQRVVPFNTRAQLSLKTHMMTCQIR